MLTERPAERTLHLGDALRSAFDDMIVEAAAEVFEHEEHVAEAKRRLLNLQNLRAVMDAPPAPETIQ